MSEATILGLVFGLIREIIAAANGSKAVDEAAMRGIESVHDARAKAKFGIAWCQLCGTHESVHSTVVPGQDYRAYYCDNCASLPADHERVGA